MEFINDKAPIEEMLRKREWGVMATTVDGQPYIVPLNYAYVHDRIVFHAALKGRKLDEIAANPRVCFCVGSQEGTMQDHQNGDPCHMNHGSVQVFGRAQVVPDGEWKVVLANAFNRMFNPVAKELDEKRLVGCAIVEIVIEEMVARREINKKRTWWRYVAGK
jgi:hypothetical protein